jgi:hypothetical protein
MHPLSGSNIRMLVRALVEHKGVSRRAAPQTGLTLAVALPGVRLARRPPPSGAPAVSWGAHRGRFPRH